MNLALTDFKSLLCVYLLSVKDVYKMSTFYVNRRVFASVISSCLHFERHRTEIFAILCSLNLRRSFDRNGFIHEMDNARSLYRNAIGPEMYNSANT